MQKPLHQKPLLTPSEMVLSFGKALEEVLPNLRLTGTDRTVGIREPGQAQGVNMRSV